MATGPSEEKLREMVQQIESKDYKVLTKDEYEALLSLRTSKEGQGTGVLPSTDTKQMPKLPAIISAISGTGTCVTGTSVTGTSVTGTPLTSTHMTSTPQVSAAHGGAIPKFNFPGVSPVPRFQQLLNNSQPFNTSYIAQPYNAPKLPFFSGSEEPSKGEVTYEVWSFEVKCLQNTPYLQESVLLQSIRTSLKGSARSLLVPLGEKATVTDILNKLDGFYGNVSSSETLIQTFYSDFQKESETIVQYGSRLEQTLSRAIRYGHIDFVAKDAMLRSKFWTGLRSQQLKNSTRHLYDSIKDFQTLLREVRKVEQEDLNSNRPATKQKTAQLHSGQTSDSSDTHSQLLKQMSELMSRMKAMESKLEKQQQATASANSQPSFQSYQPRFNQSRGRGYYRGNYRGSRRGGYGRGFQNYTSNNQNSQSNNNRGGNSRGSNRGGTIGRGANRGGSGTGGTESLNF
ncbi:MAG: hypothetical protein JAY74_14665 [Candidatus Thiodiazotropha taylori]|nr:hypothetical protein [Candidatus Thiodiazotropha taylori]